jgi:hypothetical protein
MSKLHIPDEDDQSEAPPPEPDPQNVVQGEEFPEPPPLDTDNYKSQDPPENTARDNN